MPWPRPPCFEALPTCDPVDAAFSALDALGGFLGAAAGPDTEELLQAFKAALLPRDSRNAVWQELRRNVVAGNAARAAAWMRRAAGLTAAPSSP